MYKKTLNIKMYIQYYVNTPHIQAFTHGFWNEIQPEELIWEEH